MTRSAFRHLIPHVLLILFDTAPLNPPTCTLGFYFLTYFTPLTTDRTLTLWPSPANTLPPPHHPLLFHAHLPHVSIHILTLFACLLPLLLLQSIRPPRLRSRPYELMDANLHIQGDRSGRHLPQQSGKLGESSNWMFMKCICVIHSGFCTKEKWWMLAKRSDQRANPLHPRPKLRLTCQHTKIQRVLRPYNGKKVQNDVVHSAMRRLIRYAMTRFIIDHQSRLSGV